MGHSFFHACGDWECLISASVDHFVDGVCAGQMRFSVGHEVDAVVLDQHQAGAGIWIETVRRGVSRSNLRMRE